MSLNPTIVDLIVSARATVRDFEKEEIGLDGLLRRAYVPGDFAELSLVHKVVAVYAVLHRVEAAVKASREKAIFEVQEAVDAARGLRPIIELLLNEVPQPREGSELEQAGSIFLLSELNWGLRIINETLPTCGY